MERLTGDNLADSPLSAAPLRIANGKCASDNEALHWPERSGPEQTSPADGIDAKSRLVERWTDAQMLERPETYLLRTIKPADLFAHPRT